ncbi:ArsR/SmtB family transcription factor [Microbacterium sp. CJ88]|uniref:ArsR/SmtB family transcription factor n=1 Tax=Microbacterium sp. CJ88 TaxID=3445672 RepID=UPI003F65B934
MNPFAALADPARRRIVDILASGEHTAGQLAEVVGGEFRISRTAVSKHLGILRLAGLVDARIDGPWRWYRLGFRGMDVIEHAVADLRWKLDRAVGWDAENLQDYDPIVSWPPAPEPAVGRPRTPGRRGRQTEAPRAADPDAGLFPPMLLPP